MVDSDKVVDVENGNHGSATPPRATSGALATSPKNVDGHSIVDVKTGELVWKPEEVRYCKFGSFKISVPGSSMSKYRRC